MVFNKNFFRLVIILFFCISTFFTYAEDTGENINESFDIQKNKVYYFEQEQKEYPVFTQILRWTKNEAVLYYELSLKTSTGQMLFQNKRVEKNELEVKLKPGTYFYKVYAFNMLEVCEEESEWIRVEIKQAHLPEIKRLSPETLYIEDEVSKLTVTGTGFQPDADTYFISENSLIKRVVKPTSISEEKIVFDFEKPEAFLGAKYFLKVVDKSGLSDTSKEFNVKYRKPIDFYIGLSYTPCSPIYDGWYKEYWDKKMYPLSATGEVGLIFWKSAFGFLGTEARVTFRKTSFQAEALKVKSNNYLVSANLLYEYWFVKKVAFTILAGGGVSATKLTSEHTNSGHISKEKVLDPMYTIGLGFRVKPIKYLYIDIGVYIDQFFNYTVKPLFIFPEIGIGFRY
ncbi:MAG: hypothetical protein P1P64_07660 [Treponemataceae bacterium]